MKNYCHYNKKLLFCSLFYILLTLLLYSSVNQAYPYSLQNACLLILLVLITVGLIPLQLCKETFLLKIYGIFIFIITPFITYIMIEFLNNNNALQLSGIRIAMNLFWYYAMYCLLFVLSNRTSLALVVGNVFFVSAGIINQFILQFKGVPIHPGDLLALQTALSVSDAYTFQLNQTMLLVIIITVLICVLAVKGNLSCYKWKVRIPINLSLISIILIYSSFFFDKQYIEKMDVRPYVWSRTQGYIDNGTLLSFMTNIEYLFADKPEGYTKAAAQEVLSSYSNNTETGNVVINNEAPTIITIMNESFSDLTRLGVTEMSSDYLSYFHSIDTPMVSGNLYVSICGGLTSNTEFEFLTGNSMALLPEGSIPFINYVHEGASSIIGDLNEKGYKTHFIHPYESTGWGRDIAYQCFGVSNTSFIDDFYDPELLRGKVSDRSSYDKVIDIYNNNDTNAPLFIFNVTMQNHGGYDTGYEKSVTLNMKGDYPLTEEYLSIVQQSDSALQFLLDYFSQEDSPVIILFFGDHQPSIEAELWNEVIGKPEEERTIEEIMINYQVPFFIWANYEIEEKEYSHISANYLSNLLYETAGLNLNDYQVFLKTLYEDWPVITVRGCMDTDGQWFYYDEIKDLEEIKKYQYVEYLNLFDY
ncbi:LTA synthase family protein [Lactonifactor longoviformis]|uniref:LTA synthase family protein n=2 Tax=Clostridiaceae TaxID=31979 RepID=UPI0012B09918|nr:MULTISPECIES: LTA synthase family protein [Lactonifactor]MSB68246.1 sulfatase-like hydrolase/transferase [Lactonifactor sp. BIOML-A7]MCB5712139.1 LTA synthase family protein [Lactonifactor longoviformis]MCB5716183.1 LTA synthase family protein [Lactonifactor longoviformis]MCQ4671026.1 LTA synthase family protein [Lactonifactor longoviformis]MRZ99951.1 sulfatase-like hydrolase/transferase [Lactonifactor sp. BIOML-A5]